MMSQSLTVLVAAATLALAKTPLGFTPESTNDLVVVYSGISAQNGAVISKSATANMPQVGTTMQLTGKSYAVIMVDLDIPTNSPPQTSTLLHWMQMDLIPSTTASSLNTTNGHQNVFLLQNTGNAAAAAMYLGPSPPNRTPLSHRYTQVLVDTSAVTQQESAALSQAAQTRMGFNVMQVLMSANLMSKVVAGNSFNVTNPGPATEGGGTGTTSASPALAGAGSVSASSGLVFACVAAVGLFLRL